VLLHHFRLQLQPEIQSFLTTHTTETKFSKVGSSTFRASKTTPFKWIEYYTSEKKGMEYIKNVEKTCQKALDIWGYASLYDEKGQETNKTTFNPVLEPPWSEMRLI
jgi:hypothetical protein